jgi:peptide/nickel transport system substrate-binding protein
MKIPYFLGRIANLCLIFLFLIGGMGNPVYAKSMDGSVAATNVDASLLTPRTETLYFNGQQWGPVVGWNPYAGTNNNILAIAQQDNPPVVMFETPYMYNMLDGQVYPLLADGPYTWNGDQTELTFKIKTAAQWSDGTPVTAEDVAYTWITHTKYGTDVGYAYQDYILSIDAMDAQTVRVRADLDEYGKAINPLIVASYLSQCYVIQKDWTEVLEARTGGDADAFKSDTAEDVIYSGPYHKYFSDDTRVVYVRNDNYWGKNASMWGKLPAPKYLAHVIYPDNDAGTTALLAGEVDVSQQFNANVQDLWLKDDLPISTYMPDAPYQIGASLPTAFYNLQSYGLDQPAVRKAIAIAVDYPSVIANAITNQSATFDQVPRSLMNPTAGEQALYDHNAVKDLQWAGKDIAGAKKLLDDAGIKDTNGDGWREYKGKKLSYVATCPNGWTDWQAAIELVADAGKAIGIYITTNYPEWSVYQTVVTASDKPFPVGYDIFMMWSDATGPTEPWSRIRKLMSSEFVGMASNWNGNWGGYTNPAADALIQAIPGETDPAIIKADYTELTRIYLTDIPSFTLMYRPEQFYTVNESVWTGFPKADDGSNPPIPPLMLTDGYGIAGLYHLNSSPSKNVEILIGGSVMNSYYLSSHAGLRKNYPASNSGPVIAETLNASSLVASQRVIYGGRSYSEMMGLPKEQLSKEYWFPYYNNVAMDSQLRVSNLGGSATTIKVYLGTQQIDSYTLGAGGATRKGYSNRNGGPLKVTSSSTNILATVRVLYGGKSYSEIMGLPKEQLAMEYLFPYYNNVAMDSQLRVSNVGGATTVINVYLGSSTTPIDSYTLGAGGATRKNYTGKNGGPLRVTSTASNILTTVRVMYASNSYSELMGLPVSALTTDYWYPVYDSVSLDSQLRVSNVGSGSTTIKVYARGSLIDTYTLATGAATRKSYRYNTGPLHVVSSSQPILSTIRMLYTTPGYASYYEMMGFPGQAAQLSTQYFFPWYNNSGMNSEMRFALP